MLYFIIIVYFSARIRRVMDVMWQSSQVFPSSIHLGLLSKVFHSASTLDWLMM